MLKKTIELPPVTDDELFRFAEIEILQAKHNLTEALRFADWEKVHPEKESIDFLANVMLSKHSKPLQDSFKTFLQLNSINDVPKREFIYYLIRQDLSQTAIRRITPTSPVTITELKKYPPEIKPVWDRWNKVYLAYWNQARQHFKLWEGVN